MTNRRKVRRAKKLSLAISDALLESHLGLDETWDWDSGPDISKAKVKEPEFSNEIKALVELGCKKSVLYWCVDYFLQESDFTFPDRKEFLSLIRTFPKASKLITKYSLEIATVAIESRTAPPDWNIWEGPRKLGNETDLPSYEDLPLDMRCNHVLARLPWFLSWCAAVAEKWEAPDVRPAKNGAIPISAYLELILGESRDRGRAGASHNRVVQLLACVHTRKRRRQDETIDKNLYNFRRRSPRIYRLLRRSLRQFHAKAKE
jgi:hypothetical protein